MWRMSKWEALRALFSLCSDIRKEHYDVLLDFSLAPEFSFVLKWLGIPRRIGLDYRNRGRFLTDRIFLAGFDDRPVAEYYLDTLRRLGQSPVAGNYRTELWTTEEDERFADSFFLDHSFSRNVIGILPGGGAAFGAQKGSYRRWGATQFATLCDKVWENFRMECLVFATPGEEGITETLVHQVKGKVTVAHQTTLRQMASLMKRCRAVICNDSGPLHVAVAAGAKTVSLFGPVDPRVYGPYTRQTTHHAIVTQSVVCSPCYRRFKLPECAQNVCLQWISPEKVLEALQGVLEKASEE